MNLNDQRMSLVGAIWHSGGTSPTVELVFQSHEAPPRPAHIREDLWYGGGGETLSVTIPVPKKATTNPPIGTGLIGQDADGKDIYVQYTWNSATQKWDAGPRVNPNTGVAI